MLQYNLHFPTIISKHHDKEFANKVLPIAQNILNNNSHKNLSYESTYDQVESITKLKNYRWIDEKIISLANQYCKDNKYNTFPWGFDTNLFVSRMKKGDNHKLHDHPTSCLSGVVYLNTGGEKAQITFETEQIRQWTGFTPIEECLQNRKQITYEVEVGDILMWESWVLHYVPYFENIIRETLVFNVFPRVNYNVEG
tara:strand:+ start:335 stop:925 length:591 start_codon:yes stop_codon:yes gene_type:complete